MLPFCPVFCGAVLPCSLLRVVLSCLALLCCGLLCGCAVFVGVSVCVLRCAVGCSCLLCRVSSRAVWLGCSRCGLLSGFGLRCRVLCCAVSLGAVLRRCNGSSDSTQIIHQCDQNFNDSQMYISAVNFLLVFMFSVRRQMSPVSARRVAFVFRDFPIGFI